MLLQIVRYHCGLSHDEVARRFEGRAPRYREVPGLLQQLYVHFPATGEHGGVEVWDSTESLRRGRDTNLAGTLEQTYTVIKPPVVESADVTLALHPERLVASP